jgi:hypothetical protein
MLRVLEGCEAAGAANAAGALRCAWQVAVIAFQNLAPDAWRWQRRPHETWRGAAG